MQKIAALWILVCFCFSASAQPKSSEALVLKVSTEQQAPLAHATVELLHSTDSTLVKAQVTDSLGMARFWVDAGRYRVRVSRVGYNSFLSSAFSFSPTQEHRLPDVVLVRNSETLQGVTVSAQKPLIELQPDKTIINVDAGITNAGATLLETLEKMPGVSIDRNGTISLKGRSGVLVLIDGKQTFLSGAELTALLSGMSAAQVSQVELMEQPPARFDAAGNAGVINIKTKKGQQRGFNGSFSTALGQGFYPKNNNNLQVNYRSGRLNLFLNYSLNANQGLTRVYALRTYFQEDGKSVAALLEQPSFLKGVGYTNNLRTGADYFLSDKTTLGLTLTGLLVYRPGQGNNTGLWMSPGRRVDSVIRTHSNNTTRIRNGGASLSFRHQFTPDRELTADVDVLDYRIRSRQFFENSLEAPAGYTEATRATVPSDIRILSAKSDYHQQVGNTKLEGGWKSAYTTTDNLAAYENRNGNSWTEDHTRTNHFLYKESIHAVYGSAQTTSGKWQLQGGLRYERTHYDAHQLGNAVQKDSSFSRRYNSLFPTTFISFTPDSTHSFTLSAGRRIDRPPFQKLNPFVFIINKYTSQRGNPYYRPQFTWNVEFSHLYKDLLVTGLSYSITHDYFSQIFTSDSVGNIVYTEGNLGRRQVYGLSAGLHVAPARWWSLTAQAVLNHKRLEGIIGRARQASINQASVNINNQFRFNKGWAGELSGFYNTRSQEDIQEILDPYGQVSLGLSKSLLQNKASLKLSVRDLFYTNRMKGLSYFHQAQEYFDMSRDTRVATLSFIWRFGKPLKSAVRHSEGAASDEVQRVGAGN